jgi:hypothetical protein
MPGVLRTISRVGRELWHHVKLVAADANTTTGDTLRALVTRMSTLDDLT